MATMRIGTAPVTWGIEGNPDGALQLPFEQVLSEMRKSGYAGTELGPPGFLPNDPDALAKLLKTYCLDLVSAYCALDLHSAASISNDMEEIKKTAKTLTALGAQQIVIGEWGSPSRYKISGRVCSEAGDDVLDKAGWKRLRQRVETVCEVCVPLGLKVSFHPHVGTYVETSGEIDQFLDAVKGLPVGLCLDTGHLAYAGDEPVKAFKTYAPHINLCHLKDVKREILQRCLQRRLDLTETTRAGVFVPLGQGDVDFGALLTALYKLNYNGWLVVEQDRILTQPDDTLADARVSYSFLATLLKALEP